MGSLVFHAGMPKAGSSGIQKWLVQNSELLAGRGLSPVRLTVIDGRLNLTQDLSHGMNSGAATQLLRGPDGRGVIDRFMEDLDASLQHLGGIVISGESLSVLFWRPEAFFEALLQLGTAHDVTVAYYVRPQHTALEAAWRQWGFRMDGPPAAYVRQRAGTDNHMRYAETLRRIADLQGPVDFVMRPFRRDLLHGHDIASDFAHHFLGLEVGARDRSEVNRGLSLEVTNALQVHAGRSIWPSPHDNREFNRLKKLLQKVEIPDSEGTNLGRSVLQAWCHQEFGRSNEALVEMLGWGGGPFVPPTDAPADLDLLNEYWAPAASAGLVECLRSLTEAALVSPPPRRAG